MNNDIGKISARIICGAIRRRKSKFALFRTRTGFRLRSVHRVKDSELGRDGFVGVYTPQVSYQQIQTDWNEAI